MEPLTTGRLAQQGQVNIETIRYYERQGLLQRPSRLPSGYRSFPQESVQRVRFIKRAQKLGFTLHEIKELLSLRVGRTGQEIAGVKQLAKTKIADIEEKIRVLTGMRAILKDLETHCPGNGPASGCPILESLEHADIERA
ncbi:MAG TPA: MerR family DNA-binding protein [Acidobacteriaceae bacterium]|jgi:MerR family mercuric resistance operon transcriptional regulator|nr:MerR family DNA-binding protein [Acidobacteriaceae bacterium]